MCYICCVRTNQISVSFIGIYSTEEKAKAAMERLRARPSFRDYPAGFEIHPQRVDATG